jgi:hypothetical protein
MRGLGFMPSEMSFLLKLRNLERPQIAFSDRSAAAYDQCDNLRQKLIAIRLSTIH